MCGISVIFMLFRYAYVIFVFFVYPFRVFRAFLRFPISRFSRRFHGQEAFFHGLFTDFHAAFFFSCFGFFFVHSLFVPPAESHKNCFTFHAPRVI